MKGNKIDYFVFLKGMLMGICDLIPGISGGTVAFITGIYERLIKAVKSFSIQNILFLLKSLIFFNFKIFFKKLKDMDFYFLLILVFGILSAIILGSKLVNYLLDFYFGFLMAFFLGLIVASLKVIYSHIESHKFSDRILMFLGFVFGVMMLFLNSSQLDNPNLLYVFFGGFLAISAMFLPGISGSFILLVLGLYKYIISALDNILLNLKTLVVFGFGVIAGVYVVSRFIAFLFDWNKSKTLYFLLGLVAGSLFIPIRDIYEVTDFGYTFPIVFSVYSILFAIAFILVELLVMFSVKKK